MSALRCAHAAVVAVLIIKTLINQSVASVALAGEWGVLAWSGLDAADATARGEAAAKKAIHRR